MARTKYDPAVVFKAVAAVDNMQQSKATKKSIADSAGIRTGTLNSWYKKFKGASVEAIAEALQGDNTYVQIFRRLFEIHAKNGTTDFRWHREELTTIAKKLGVKVPKNIGDNIYSLRYGRDEFPDEVKALAPPGKSWLILPDGKSKYRCVTADYSVIRHDPYLKPVKIPDATPQIVAKHAKGDEQAVLARLNYNRLLDIFLGLVSYPLQSHMRTTVEAFGKSQIEIDDVLLGLDRFGAQFVIPVQAKSANDVVGTVQIVQDVYACVEKFPGLCCRPVAAKTIATERQPDGYEVYTIAMMEFGLTPPWDIYLKRQSHYRLVRLSDLSASEILAYRERSSQEHPDGSTFCLDPSPPPA